MGEIAKGFGLLGGMSSSQEKGGLQLYGGFFDKNPVAGGSYTFPGIVNDGSARTLASLSTNWPSSQTFILYHSGNLGKEKKIDSYKLVISQNAPATLSGATLNVYQVALTSYTTIGFAPLLSKSLVDWPGAGQINTFVGEIGYTPPANRMITFGITTPGTTIPNLVYALTINFSNDLV